MGFLYETLKWRKVSYRYWISNRVELQFEMVTLSSASFKNNVDMTIEVSTVLQKPLQNLETY